MQFFVKNKVNLIYLLYSFHKSSLAFIQYFATQSFILILDYFHESENQSAFKTSPLCRLNQLQETFFLKKRFHKWIFSWSRFSPLGHILVVLPLESNKTNHSKYFSWERNLAKRNLQLLKITRNICFFSFR